MTDKWWADRPCVVTGAGRGIGRALAERLAGRGAPLGICARSRDEVGALTDDLVALGAGPVLAAVLDVRDADALLEFAADCRSQLGPAYALVNNAAILGPVGRIDQVDLAAWQTALATNVTGVVHATAAFVPQMAERGEGRVLMLSGGGIGGPGVAPNISAYTTSKAAIATLTETLASELLPLGVTVNAVAPGAQPTGFVTGIVEAGTERAGDDLYEATMSQQAAGMALDPFFSVVEYLLAPESSWLTGRLLSARWDRVASLRDRRTRITESSLLTMRRIDDELFTEGTRSKGR